MTVRELDKLIVALMIVAILTIITTGITVSREVDRLQKITACLTVTSQEKIPVSCKK